MKNIPFDGDEQQYTSNERSQLQFINDKIYEHKTLRINFTTYDLQRDQDFINLSTKANIMIAGYDDDDDEHQNPYWYAQVLGIYHALISYSNQPVKLMEFIWVRWYGKVPDHMAGWKARHLHAIGFIPLDDNNGPQFGFIDPKIIIRSVHLIPAFYAGKTDSLLEKSIIRKDSEENLDWKYFYINWFADRDMLMRYLRLGVGHISLQSYTIQLGPNEEIFNENISEISSTQNLPEISSTQNILELSATQNIPEEENSEKEEEFYSDIELELSTHL